LGFVAKEAEGAAVDHSMRAQMMYAAKRQWVVTDLGYKEAL